MVGGFLNEREYSGADWLVPLITTLQFISLCWITGHLTALQLHCIEIHCTPVYWSLHMGWWITHICQAEICSIWEAQQPWSNWADITISPDLEKPYDLKIGAWYGCGIQSIQYIYNFVKSVSWTFILLLNISNQIYYVYFHFWDQISGN